MPPKPKPKTNEDTVLATAGRTAATDAASPDTLLLVGGLALFVLVLGDTVFLALSSEMSAAPRRDPDNVEGDLIRDIEYASRQYFLVCVRNPGIVRSIEQVAPGDKEVMAARRSTVIQNVKRAERWIKRLQDAGVCDDIDPWTTAMALHTMNVRVAYDHLLPHGEEAEADVDMLAKAVTRIWARTVGLEKVEP